MVHYPGSLNPSPLLTCPAQRLARKMQCPDPFPPGAAVQIAKRVALPALVIFLLLLFLMPLTSASIGQGRATRIPAWTLWSKGTHAALFFSGRGGFISQRGRVSSCGRTMDFPFSMTYPGRRFSSRYTSRQSRFVKLNAFASWLSRPL